MNIKELMDYLETCDATYPITNSFEQDGYKQKNGAYITKAKKMKAEPNQRWHYLVSYLPHFDPNLDVSVMYNRALCPEMFLYLLEASGIDKKLVLQASDIARKTIDIYGGKGRNKATVNMRHLIPYEIVEKSLEKQKVKSFGSN